MSLVTWAVPAAASERAVSGSHLLGSLCCCGCGARVWRPGKLRARRASVVKACGLLVESCTCSGNWRQSAREYVAVNVWVYTNDHSTIIPPRISNRASL